MFKTDLKPDEQGLNIIIVGCGKVGSTITERLYSEGHDITVIDKNPAAVGALTDAYDIMGIVGNGASYSTQMEAGVENADLIIAVTDSDELNLLCCTVAQRVTNCDAIARVRNPDYAEEIDYLREKLGLSIIINPELEAANEIARILYLPTALSVSPFARGRAEIIRFKLQADNMLCDKRLMDMGALVKNIRFCAIERGENVYTPDGHFILKAGDTVSFISTARSAAKLSAFSQTVFTRPPSRMTENPAVLSISAAASVSVSRGQFSSAAPSHKTAAASSGKAAFLAPLILTSPLSGISAAPTIKYPILPLPLL